MISISSRLRGVRLVFALGVLEGEVERGRRVGEGCEGGEVAVLLKTYVSASGFGVGVHIPMWIGGWEREMGVWKCLDGSGIHPSTAGLGVGLEATWGRVAAKAV